MVLGSNPPYLFVRCHSFLSFFFEDFPKFYFNSDVCSVNRPQVLPFKCEFLFTHFRGELILIKYQKKCQIEYFPSNYIMNLNKTILHQGRKITQISCFVSGRGKSEISSQSSQIIFYKF